MTERIVVRDLGRKPYSEILALQRDLCRQRMAGTLTDDILLLVEHDPVITLGRGTKPESLPIPPEHLARRGTPVFEVERGGDVTYHGPGQLVGYPIFNLQHHRPDLHWYLRQLETALIDGLATVGVTAERSAGQTGVWTGGRKIASIGIHVKQWITFHGFALNVTTDLSPFDLIVPCGIHGVVMTSVARELGRADTATTWADTRAAVLAGMAGAFGRTIVEEAAAHDAAKYLA